MTVGADAVHRNDPAYQEGLAHLQSGRWQEAIRCFEEALRRHPDSAAVQRSLEEAQFKAGLDAATRVRARRWVFPWRALLVRALAVAVALFLAYQAYQAYTRPGGIGERLSELRAERQLIAQRDECQQLWLEGNRQASAACCQEFLARVPDDADCLSRIAEVAAQDAIEAEYQNGVTLQEAGDCVGALSVFQSVLLRQSPYKDVRLRIEACRQQMNWDSLCEEAGADYQAGRLEAALEKYGLLREYQACPGVPDRLFEIHMALGRALVEQNPPASAAVREALDYFAEALSLRPRDTDASLEQYLARAYLDGEAAYFAGQWSAATSQLGAVVNARPDYLHGQAARLLYDAHLETGRQAEAAEDWFAAYQSYTAACALPVPDRAYCTERLAAIQEKLPPTPTATLTPVPTGIPTPAPTATTAPPRLLDLAKQKGKILFWSKNEEQSGLWMMDANGQNRVYLYGVQQFKIEYRKQYDALRVRESYSPGGARAYTTEAEPEPQIWIMPALHAQYGQLPPYQCTFNQGLSYDPVWSPDGTRIAYVSNELDSDDVWLVNADCTQPRVLSQNTWKYQWDKHPSWSPDSRQIVFWANPQGRWQLYVMDANGGSVRNLSNTEWDEYDPLWVK